MVLADMACMAWCLHMASAGPPIIDTLCGNVPARVITSYALATPKARATHTSSHAPSVNPFTCCSLRPPSSPGSSLSSAMLLRLLQWLKSTSGPRPPCSRCRLVNCSSSAMEQTTAGATQQHTANGQHTTDNCQCLCCCLSRLHADRGSVLTDTAEP